MVAVVILLALIPLLAPGFLVFQCTMMLTYAIAILGINLMLGFNGQVSLAQSAFFAVGAYVSAILVSRYDVPFAFAIVAGGIAAGAAGAMLGLPALRLPGLQLAIVSFGLAALIPQLIVKFSDFTKGVSGIAFDKPEAPAWFPGDQDQWLYVLTLLVFFLYASIVRRLLRGDTGRSIRALRDDPLVASSMGINATRVRLSIFAISSTFAGLGGGLFALVNAYVNPASFQAVKSIEFIIAGVVGGLTSIVGSLIGAAFILFVPEWTGSGNAALGALIYGVVLLLIVLLAPRGVVGLLEKACLKLASGFEKKPLTTSATEGARASKPAPSTLASASSVGLATPSTTKETAQ